VRMQVPAQPLAAGEIGIGVDELFHNGILS